MLGTDKEQEIWKPYPDYPFIEVSSLGRVRTKDRYIILKNGNKRLVKGRVLKQQSLPNGYLNVNFRVNGKLINLRVHRIVATCFIPNPNGYLEVNHKDNNPRNNAVSNLEWCTHKQNIAYREQCGVSAKEYAKVLRKPVIAVDLNSFKVLWFESQNEAACHLGAKVENVNRVIKGKLNKTHCCWFTNADENAVEKTRAKFGDDIAKKVEELISNNFFEKRLT